MAHFYGILNGSVTRCGHKNSGMSANVRGWTNGIEAHGWHDSERERDSWTVYYTGGSSGHGTIATLGTFNEGMSAEDVAVELVSAAAAIIRRSYNDPTAQALSDRILKTARAIERRTTSVKA